MKNSVMTMAIAVLFLMPLSCSKMVSDHGSPGNPQVIVKGNYSFLKSSPLFLEADRSRSPAYSALFDLSKVEKTGDTLNITVTYLEGCAVSKFEVIWSGLALLTYPETIVLILKRTTGNCGTLGNALSQVLSVNLTECLGDATLARNANIIVCNASKTAGTENADLTVHSDIALSRDTISLDPANDHCNLQFNGDTCFFQHIGDTLRIYGKVLEYGCGKQIAVITQKSDSILIRTSEIKPAGADCNLALNACFEFRIPAASGYSVVKFNGKTYTGF